MELETLENQKNATVLPELDPSCQALSNGSDELEDNKAEALLNAIHTQEVGFFELPLFFHLQDRPYHMAYVFGSFSLAKMASDYRKEIYRSETAFHRKEKPALCNL